MLGDKQLTSGVRKQLTAGVMRQTAVDGCLETDSRQRLLGDRQLTVGVRKLTVDSRC